MEIVLLNIILEHNALLIKIFVSIPDPILVKANYAFLWKF